MRADYDAYDFLIGMDDENLYYMRKTFGEDRAHKMSKLLEWCGVHRDVDDPWYTGNFDATWDDVLAGCRRYVDPESGLQSVNHFILAD